MACLSYGGTEICLLSPAAVTYLNAEDFTAAAMYIVMERTLH